MENEQNLIKLLEALSTSYPERISHLAKYIYQILNNQNLNNLDKKIIYNYLNTLNTLASDIASSSKNQLKHLLKDASNRNNTPNGKPESYLLGDISNSNNTPNVESER